MIRSIQALETYKSENGSLPRPWNKEDAEKFVAIAKKQADDLDESQVAFLTKVAFTARGRLVGNDSVLGGFIAQEVVKAIGQKYTPVRQWVGQLWFEANCPVLPRSFGINRSH